MELMVRMVLVFNIKINNIIIIIKISNLPPWRRVKTFHDIIKYWFVLVSVHSGLHADLSKPSMILTPICFGLPANLFRWVLTWDDGQLNHILQWFPFCNDHITLGPGGWVGGPRKVWPALSGFLPFGKKLIPDLGFQRINTCRKVLDIYWIYWTGCTESTGFTG